MAISPGTEIYATDTLPVIGRGVSLTQEELDSALGGPVSSLLQDDAGNDELDSILSNLAGTNFSDQSVKRILSTTRTAENWRVGEALAEAYLIDHHGCTFPWPSGRDLKNPDASPAGCDLVGFQESVADEVSGRFAFGEVKTSEEEKWPPGVMYGRTGLKKQLEDLRNTNSGKDALVKYLGHHAIQATWLPQYKRAAKRYLANPCDVSLFGLLIRDVTPSQLDLAARVQGLALSCPTETKIELRAIYLPEKTIRGLATRATSARGGGHAIT